MTDRPLHIVLRGIYFDAFANGTKTEEWRLLGRHWTLERCRPGRAVVFSRGYTRNRLTGRVTATDIRPAPCSTIYSEGAPCVVMTIRLDKPETSNEGEADGQSVL